MDSGHRTNKSHQPENGYPSANAARPHTYVLCVCYGGIDGIQVQYGGESNVRGVTNKSIGCAGDDEEEDGGDAVC